MLLEFLRIKVVFWIIRESIPIISEAFQVW